MNDERTAGIVYAFAAYVLWGILPIYWKLIDNVFSFEILANRIVWSFAFTIAIIGITKKWQELKDLFKDKKQMIFIFIASVLIAFNWGLYIWAVNSEKILEASLGYYINPLFAVALGVVLFKEKLNLWQAAALIIAAIGVLIKTLQFGQIPWVSLGLAISFGLYGATKKVIKANSITGLTLETIMLTPLALAYMASRQLAGVSAFQSESSITVLLLIGSGIVTAIPLMLFASSAKRLPMSVLGFVQYISPTINLFIGIFMYQESFTYIDMIGFCFIWSALAIYSVSQLRDNATKSLA